MNEMHLWLTIAVVALVTAAIRFLPFLVFSGKRRTPRIIERLGRSLPYAIMGMLVVYCFKGVSFSAPAGYLPALIATLVVGVLYVWRRNTLISMIAGTVCYMLLVQLVFI